MGAMTNPVAGLTRREREVWSLVATHLTNREIAARLHLSVRTVESHVSALIGKLQVDDRRALARHAGAMAAAPPRWPAPASSFVGRAAECAALLEAVTAHRMVTATGPGGVGKTRLALHVVEQFAATRRAGGRFVDLVHVNDPAMVVSAIAAACGVTAPLGGSLADALAASLAGSDTVLLLDNCEHVVEAVRDSVSHLLGACPQLAIVATSRIALRAPFEWLFTVPGLSMGEGGGDAVALFVERARAAGVHAPLDPHRVRALCASLDGMALAIELAAARCHALGLDGLMAGLDRGLRMLSSGAGAGHRHRSLRDAIAWSWRLLPAFDRELLDAVSVFASWFDVDAALAVAGDSAQRFDIVDALARLTEHSLLIVAPGEPTRYRALETIRQFGAEQLDQHGRSEAVHQRHRQWCGAALALLAGQQPDDAWCERLDRVADDVRAAVARAMDRPCGPSALQLAERLADQLLLRGRPHESQRCYEQAAQLADGDAADRPRLLRLAAGAAAARLVGKDTLRLLRDAASHAQAHGDRHAAAIDLAWMVTYMRWAPGIVQDPPDIDTIDSWLVEAGALAADAPAAEAAVAVATAFGLPDGDPRVVDIVGRAIAIARDAAAPLTESVALDCLCSYHTVRGELQLAIEQTERRRDLLSRVALDARSAFQFNDCLLMASEVHVAAGNLSQAAEAADRLAELACYRDYPHPALARRIRVDAMAGDFEAVVARGDRFLAAWQSAGRPITNTINFAPYAVAMVHGLLGDEASRARWIEITRTLSHEPATLATCRSGWAPIFDALLALDRGHADAALRRLSADLDDESVWGFSSACMWRPWYAALWAEAAVLGAHPDAKARIARAAEATRDNGIAATIVRRAVDLAQGRPGALRVHAQVFARLGCDYQRRRTEVLARSGAR